MGQITSPKIHLHTYRDNYEKGRTFEQYIISLFNQQKFQLKKWRQAEKFDDSYQPPDHHFPDVELELVFTGRRKYRFAVECKWRKEFDKGFIKWADDSQICNYQVFQGQARMPVFVAIGIGGEPCAPEKLFVTPLDSIAAFNYVSESQLYLYKRKPDRPLDYSVVQGKLF